MSGAITVSDDLVDRLISFTEEEGARSPGWYRATCWEPATNVDLVPCWTTTGRESVVEEAAYEHVDDRHRPPIGRHRRED